GRVAGRGARCGAEEGGPDHPRARRGRHPRRPEGADDPVRLAGEEALTERLLQLYETADRRDVIEIALLALALYFMLRLLGRSRGAGIVRGLSLFVIGFFLLAQVIIASFDLTVLGKVLDYLLTTVLLGLLVIFQPELRRGLMLLGRYRLLRLFVKEPAASDAEKLAA